MIVRNYLLSFLDQPLVFYPALVSSILIYTCLLLNLYSYRRHRLRPLLLITFDWFLMGMLPIVFFIFNFIDGSSFVFIRNYAGKIGSVTSLMGVLLFWQIIKLVKNENLTSLNYVMVTSSIFSMGMSFIAIKWSWVEGWQVNFIPEWTLYFLGLNTVWILIDAFINLLQIIKNETIERNKRTYKLISFGWILFIFSILFFMVERMIFDDTIIYLMISSFGLVFVAYALYDNPLSLVTYDLGLKSLIVSIKSTGMLVFYYDFVKDFLDPTDRNRMSLNSTLLQGISSALMEIISKDVYPTHLQYDEDELLITDSDFLSIYLISKRSNFILQDALKKFLVEIEITLKQVIEKHDAYYVISNEVVPSLDDKGQNELLFEFLGQKVKKYFSFAY